MLLRRALLQALMEQGLVDEHQIREMLAENEGKFKGSLLEELLNQLIERLVEEGYLTLHEEQLNSNDAATRAMANGRDLRSVAAKRSFRSH